MALTLPPERVYPSLFDEIRAKLSDEDRKLLDGWMADRAISDRRIARALTEAGHKIAASTIGKARGA